MPATLTFPGVYIEEIPSGVRTITGVATSITAFIGRTLRGPVNEPKAINSFGDYDRFFGGLWEDSSMTYAVRDFYLNGGRQAVIVRLFSPVFTDENTRQTAFNTAQTEATTAANTVATTARNAATAGALPATVASAAQGAVAAAGAASAAALQAATTVAQAAQAALLVIPTANAVAMAATTTVAAAVNILTNQAQAAANAVANAANAAAGVGGATPSSVASAAEAAVGAAGAPGPAALAAATKVAAAARSAVAAAVAPADVATAATNAVAVAVSTVTTQAQTVAAAVTGAANNAATFPGATGNSTAQAAEGSVAPAINSIRAEAQTAANSVQSAAATESGVAGATPASVATAAGAAVAAAGLPGSAALAAAALVASAAQAAVAGATTPGDVATAAANSVATSSTTVATQFQILANTIAQAARTAVTVSANDVATAAENARPAAIAAAASQAAPVTSARLSVNELNLEAANPGAWGNKLRARIDYDVALATDLNLFNLAIEVIRNVSVQPDAVRRLDKVLVKESNLARTFGALPTTRPTNSQPGNNGIVASGGDPFSAAFSSGVNLSGRAVDGRPLVQNDFLPNNARTQKLGLYALEKTDLFNILCLPPYLPSGDVDTALISEAASYCEQRRAFFILDPRSDWNDKDSAKTGVGGLGTVSKNAAVFFPRFKQPNPRRNNQVETFVPCGAVAGIFARTDTNRGVWKAPAGLDANLVGVPELTVSLTDSENGELNPLGVNCLRTMPAVGNVVWGTRTREGDDRRASEWKYIPVRRLALYIEESLYRSTQWVVFEPNDEPLWAQIRLNLGAFMHGLFRQGAFQGQTPRDAYFVKCDKETTTQNDINLGIVNIVVGFAPLKPAEFVIIKIQQIAGQIQT